MDRAVFSARGEWFMRSLTNFANHRGMRQDRLPDDYARLFDELSQPVDPKAVRAGLKELSRWLGSPQRRWETGVRS
jgi:hypothetical protein